MMRILSTPCRNGRFRGLFAVLYDYCFIVFIFLYGATAANSFFAFSALHPYKSVYLCEKAHGSLLRDVGDAVPCGVRFLGYLLLISYTRRKTEIHFSPDY